MVMEHTCRQIDNHEMEVHKIHQWPLYEYLLAIARRVVKWKNVTAKCRRRTTECPSSCWPRLSVARATGSQLRLLRAEANCWDASRCRCSACLVGFVLSVSLGYTWPNSPSLSIKTACA
ncbi:hypothetical protein ACLKA7_015768 [Drosophila subpalustris]